MTRFAGLEVDRNKLRMAIFEGSPKKYALVDFVDEEITADSNEERRELITGILSDVLARKENRGRVIAVVAPKGGSGKTALSVNLAVSLAQRHPSKTSILDLDLLFGDVTNALLLNPEHSIADAIDAPALDPTLLKVLLTRRERDLFVLTAPDSPALGEMVTESLPPNSSRRSDPVKPDTLVGLPLTVSVVASSVISSSPSVPGTTSVVPVNVTLSMFAYVSGSRASTWTVPEPG